MIDYRPAVFGGLFVLLSLAAAARAQVFDSANGPADAPILLDEEPQSGALMQFLDARGLADPLYAARIHVFGFVEGSYTYNNHPSHLDSGNKIDPDRFFDFEKGPEFNRVDLTIARPLRVTDTHYDWGFTIEPIYGSDAKYLHANGLFESGPVRPSTGERQAFFGPKHQFDILQAYVDFAVPIGKGLSVRLGKFTSLLGGISPIESVFYSHSFLFGTSEGRTLDLEGGPLGKKKHPFSLDQGDIRPLTHTGLLASYNFGPHLGTDVGFSRGWDQAFSDSNSALDVLSRIRWAPVTQVKLALTTLSGPQLPHENGDWRTFIDASASISGPDSWSFLLDGDFAYEPSGDRPIARGNPLNTKNPLRVYPRSIMYYGVAVSASYEIDQRWTASGRLEWFRDEDGFITFFPTTLYEATLGVRFTPFPSNRYFAGIQFRPEARIDWSSRNTFGDMNDRWQGTLAIDAIYAF